MVQIKTCFEPTRTKVYTTLLLTPYFFWLVSLILNTLDASSLHSRYWYLWNEWILRLLFSLIASVFSYFVACLLSLLPQKFVYQMRFFKPTFLKVILTIIFIALFFPGQYVFDLLSTDPCRSDAVHGTMSFVSRGSDLVLACPHISSSGSYEQEAMNALIQSTFLLAVSYLISCSIDAIFEKLRKKQKK